MREESNISQGSTLKLKAESKCWELRKVGREIGKRMKSKA